MTGLCPVPHDISGKVSKIVMVYNDFPFTLFIIQVAKRLPNFLLLPASSL